MTYRDRLLISHANDINLTFKKKFFLLFTGFVATLKNENNLESTLILSLSSPRSLSEVLDFYFLKIYPTPFSFPSLCINVYFK